jgi:hypothetical protein
MRRREFIAGLGSAAAWPLAARAQRPALPVIGILGSTSAQSYASPLAAFMQGLRETTSSKARTWQSNPVGRTINMIDCRTWRPTWCALRYR